MAGKLVSLVGQRFGRLVVVAPAGYIMYGRTRRIKMPMWSCRCDCGATKTVARNYLKGSANPMCGECPRPARRVTPPGHSGLRALLSTYRHGAKIRGLPFELTETEFKAITSSDCAYCGSPPTQVCRPNTHAKKPTDWRNYAAYTYNGVDRVNNDLGYVLANVVPACGPCNNMKKDMPRGAFVARVMQIAAHLQSTCHRGTVSHRRTVYVTNPG